MNPSTVAQSAPPCRDDILLLISESRNPVSAREIRFRLAGGDQHLLREITAVVDRLIEEGVIDYEQRRSDVKLYFLATKPPRLYLREVRADAPPPVRALAQNSWCSMLGGV